MTALDTYVAFDTETTGFGPEARILEIGLVVFELGVLVHTWSQLLLPEGVDWENPKVQKALEVNHITRADLAGKPTFSEVMLDVLHEFSFDLWVAHNAEFDVQMLSQEFARAGRKFEPPPLTLCTMQLAGYRTNAKGNKLADVAARYGVPQDGAHRAVVDATVCGSIFREMIRKDDLPPTLHGLKELSARAAKSWKTRSRW